MKYKISAVVLIFMLALSGCGKKESVKPNAKFLGTYKVKDVWASNKTEIGSGSLEYELNIKPNGDSLVTIDNINKTLFGVRGVAKDDTLYILSQTGKSLAGRSYELDEQRGYIDGGKLVLNCDYNDLYIANLIGSVSVTMVGTKNTEEK